jgi:hypothetical protein
MHFLENLFSFYFIFSARAQTKDQVFAKQVLSTTELNPQPLENIFLSHY